MMKTRPDLSVRDLIRATYRANLDSLNSWHETEHGFVVLAKIGNGIYKLVIHCYWKVQKPGYVFFSPFGSGETWVTESTRLHKDLVRFGIQLDRVPSIVDATWRTL
jgi:hypothetical protein